MLVREFPFDALPIAWGTVFVLAISGSVCLSAAMIWDDKKWSEVLIENVYMRFILPLCAVFAVGVMVVCAALSHQRPATSSDYESVGSYAATVTRVYSQVVEVDTDFGVSLPVHVSMMPEGAAEVGSRLTVDVSKLSPKPGLEVLRPIGGVSPIDSGDPVFVASDVCKSAGVLSCSAAFDDAEGDGGMFPNTYYAVTGVRANN